MPLISEGAKIKIIKLDPKPGHGGARPGAGRKPRANWSAIRGDYEEGRLAIAEVARFHAVPVSSLRSHAKAEGWVRVAKHILPPGTSALEFMLREHRRRAK